jgi:hypothetical protein
MRLGQKTTTSAMFIIIFWSSYETKAENNNKCAFFFFPYIVENDNKPFDSSYLLLVFIELHKTATSLSVAHDLMLIFFQL